MLPPCRKMKPEIPETRPFWSGQDTNNVAVSGMRKWKVSRGFAEDASCTTNHVGLDALVRAGGRSSPGVFGTRRLPGVAPLGRGRGRPSLGGSEWDTELLADGGIGQAVGLHVALARHVGDGKLQRAGQLAADPVQGIEARAAAIVLAAHLPDDYLGVGIDMQRPGLQRHRILQGFEQGYI